MTSGGTASPVPIPEPQPASGPIGTWSWERFKRFARFGIVGASGFVVNEVALALIVSTFSVNYLVGAIAATQVSTLWNFSLVELWAFRGLDAKRSAWHRLLFFFMVNNAALLLRGPILVVLTSGLGLNYLVSNLVSLGVLTLVRFAVADNWIWAAREQGDRVRDLDLAMAEPERDDEWPTLAGEVAIASVPGIELTDGSDWLAADTASIVPSGHAVLTVVEAHTVSLVDPAPERALGLARWVWPAAIAVVAVAVRVWNLNGTGFNSDEVVYSSQAALLAGKSQYGTLFTLFRAHPLLFQGLLSLVYRISMSDYLARMLSVAFGLGTVAVGFWAARSLYGRRVAMIAAAIIAVMPYTVVLSRQVLLDGPMVFFATLALGLVARFVATREPNWLYAASVALGLTFLTKETGILMAVAMYAFLILTPQLRVRVRDLFVSLAILGGFVFVFPLAVALGKRSNTGEQFFLWQVLRRPNHGFMYYFDHIPQALGLGVVLLALIALCFLRRDRTWRETLLLCWIVVPTVFFVLWPVKGYQYLLPIAPAMAILASRALAALPATGWFHLNRVRVPAVAITSIVGVGLAISLLVPTWLAVRPSEAAVVDAGAGGLPRGREAGAWIGATAPIGAKVITIGPSMSNLVRYFGARESFGLSVSTNPLHRNPVYEPVGNADLRLRRGEIQYLVWDATSASRAPSFGSQLVNLAHRFHGRVVHRERVGGRDAIVVYQVRP
jgi:putative flippase GtrA